MHGPYVGLSIDTRRVSEQKSVNPIWGPGHAFFQTKPWPQLACIPWYDTSQKSHSSTSETERFEFENGSATYVFVEPCPHGGANHFRLLNSQWQPAPEHNA